MESITRTDGMAGDGAYDDIARWIAWIGLPDEVGPALAASHCRPEDVAAIQARLTADAAPLPGADPACVALAALAGLATMCERHRRRGVPEEVSQATAADLALWMREHYRRHSVWGLSEGGWLCHHLAGRLFRFGRLQFMPGICSFPELRPTDPLQAGDPVLEVHIPAGEALLPEACLASFAAATAFFAHEPWRGFTCESWLLGAQLSAVLPPDANILAFQRFFIPLPGHMDDRQMIERVFGVWPLDPATAPRETKLQRAVLAHYAAGGCLEGGVGFRPRGLTEAANSTGLCHQVKDLGAIGKV